MARLINQFGRAKTMAEEFVLDGWLFRFPQENWTVEDSERIEDAFLKWAESQGLMFGGVFGVRRPEQKTAEKR